MRRREFRDGDAAIAAGEAFTKVTHTRRQLDDLDAYRRAGTTRGGVPSRISSGRESRTATTAAYLSPAVAQRRPLIMRCAGPTRESSESTSALRSIAFTQELKAKHGLDNLEVRQLSVERAGELGADLRSRRLHGRSAPPAGSRRGLARTARRARADGQRCISWCMRHTGARASTCCRIIAGGSGSGGRKPRFATSLQASKRSRPTIRSYRSCANHRTSRTRPGMADALLHPQDRSYSVPQLMDFLDRAEFVVRALDTPGAIPAVVRRACASSPHTQAGRAVALRRNMRRSSSSAGRWSATAVVAYRTDLPRRRQPRRFRR